MQVAPFARRDDNMFIIGRANELRQPEEHSQQAGVCFGARPLLIALASNFRILEFQNILAPPTCGAHFRLSSRIDLLFVCYHMMMSCFASAMFLVQLCGRLSNFMSNSMKGRQHWIRLSGLQRAYRRPASRAMG